MLKSSVLGKFGENIAKNYISKKGLNIIERNYHSRYGEIDIIAQINNIIAFIEVKTRKNNSIVKPVESVNKSKRNKIFKTAFTYLERNNIKFQPRFDIIEILTKGSECEVLNINHIENAFFQEEEYAYAVF